MAEEKKTALITGASSGIGLELAKELAARKFDLVLTARSEGKLKDLAKELGAKHGVGVSVVPLDLAKPGAAAELSARLSKEGRQVDVLVNNAGYGLGGKFLETDLGRELDMIQLNISALVHLTKLLAPAMVARKQGRILNVASTAAFVPGPFMAIYYATKAFVLSFSEALSVELEGTGVTCTVLCPGPTDTGFQAVASIERSRLVKSRVSGFMRADVVARAGVDGLLKGRGHVVPGVRNKMVVQSTRLGPRTLVAKITGSLNSPVSP
jgi:short-subunit dehydrogenase